MKINEPWRITAFKAGRNPYGEVPLGAPPLDFQPSTFTPPLWQKSGRLPQIATGW
jgi:hypothetical protein